jgi:hypothetical protein
MTADAVRRIWRLAAGALLAWSLVAPARAAAQVDPRGPLRTIRTTHLRVHYPAALDSLARVAAVYAETAYDQLARELAAPAGPIDLLLADNVDASNGFAQVFPTNRVVIYAVPPVANRELRFHDDWLRLVITHELAHIFHLDRARGLWRVGRTLFGRNPLFFPNAFTPSWVKEGLAVHYESALTGSGRQLSTEFPLLLRAAALDSALVPPSRWSLSTTRYPRGQTAYAYGTLLMDRAVSQAEALPDSTLGMRRFVDATAAHLVPFRLQHTSRRGFGQSFNALFAGLRDSLLAAPSTRNADAVWTLAGNDGWYVAAPRWMGNDSLVWSASNGREVTGMYMLPVPAAGAPASRPHRVAWRNGLDVNVPVDSGRAVLFAQPERQDPFITRSDLYRGDGAREWRLTNGARLTQPDVRNDGSLVAVQYVAGGSRLVRVSADGQAITPLTTTVSGERWAEPRWAPAGDRLAAVQLLAGGVQRVVVLDAAGDLQRVVTGARAVFASPSFTPDGRRLVWASDRSGRMQVETAPVVGAPDTLSWRAADHVARHDVRLVHPVSTGAYEPSVSPDGSRVVALVQRVDGNHVAWAPLDTMGPLVRDTWYAPQTPVRAPANPDSQRIVMQRSTGYETARQLLPRYWMPLLGEGRLGDLTYGASSSSVDIAGRHAWSANVLVEPTRRETDAALVYRYAGLGVPVSDLSFTQEWDGTFVVRTDEGARLGLVARRRRFLTLGSTWTLPRVRWALSGTVGAQYEMRDFTAVADSILGPSNSPLRLGTRYPSFFLNTQYSTARLALRGVSVEEGITLNTNTAYRWREDQTATGSVRTLLSGRAFVPLPLPGYARHVLASRATVGWSDDRTLSEFTVGGTSGLSTEIIPGVTIGDPARAFPVRGTAPGVQRGTRAVGGSLEYRAPLVMFRRVPSPFTLYSDRVALSLFTDGARAWCSTAVRANALTGPVLCLPASREGWLASAGAELLVDLAVQYDVPYRVRLGAAAPYLAPAGVPRGGTVYLTLGGYF